MSAQPQTSTAPLFAANAKYANGVAPGYRPTKGSGLTLSLSDGTAFCSGSVVTYTAGTLTMSASTTNYVYLDTASAGVPATKTTPFTSADIPIAIVVTGSSTITSIADVRTPFISPGTGGTAWSALTDPSGNLALSMGAFTSTLTYGATTGANDLFVLKDTASNTGTGAILAVVQGTSTAATGLRLKLSNNSNTSPQLQLENSTAAGLMKMSVCDNGGLATSQIDCTGTAFLLSRGTALGSSTNVLMSFSGSGTNKWLGTITSNFDGVTSSEIGLTIANVQTMNVASKAAVLSIQNGGGTRLVDVTPGSLLCKSVGIALPTKSVSATYTAVANDYLLLCNGTFTVTLPTTLNPGQYLVVKNVGTGTVTVSSSANIDGSTSATLAVQYGVLRVQWDGTQWWAA